MTGATAAVHGHAWPVRSYTYIRIELYRNSIVEIVYFLYSR